MSGLRKMGLKYGASDEDDTDNHDCRVNIPNQCNNGQKNDNENGQGDRVTTVVDRMEEPGNMLTL